MRKPIIIAIDGYSSTGKSTFAKQIAKEIRYLYIDTGALYRTVTLFALNNGIFRKDDSIDTERLEALLSGPGQPDITFRISGTDGSSQTWLNGVNVEKEIRSMRVSGLVSPVAALPFVREYVNRQLLRFGKDKGVVMDGRDIGSAVFPDAELKLFMTASPEIRAQRRLSEMREKGETASFGEVLQNIRERDRIDSTRKTDPLTMAKDAILLDNSDMTVEEQLIWVRKILKEKFQL